MARVSPTECGEVSNAFGLVTSAAALVTVQPGAPILLLEPQSISRYTGGTAAFYVGAFSSEALYYQWYFNGAPIYGATAASYILTNVQPSDGGNYGCTVTNAQGSASSTPAVLTVLDPPADSYAMAVLADNPLAFWRLDETSGTTAHDYMGGHDGQYTNAVLGQPGFSFIGPGTSVAFGPPRDSYVANIGSVDFGTTGTGAAFSVEAWVKCPSGQNGDVGIVAKGTGAGGEQFSLDLGNGGSYRFFVRDYTGAGKSACSSVAPDNTWQHVVGVCDEPHGQLRVYVNGEAGQNAAISAGILQSSHAVSIGSRQSGGSAYDLNLNGLVDEVAIYNCALSEARVQAHFDARYSPGSAPVIATQSAAVTNYASLPIVFTVDVAGTPPISYQWQFNGSDIPSATNCVFSIPSLDVTNSGDYSVAVNSPFGTGSGDIAQLTVLPIPGAVDSSDGLVLHLKFDGDYIDWSGRGNRGTNVGAPSFVAGEIGSQALHYGTVAGSSFNYVTLGLRPDLQFSSNANFSVACWVRYPASDRSGNLPILGNAVGSAGYPGYVITQTGGGWMWKIGDAAGNIVPAAGPTNSINDGSWHHLVETFNRIGNAVTYLDGAPVDLRPIGHPGGSSIGDLDTGQPVNLGQDPTGAYGVSAAVDVDDVGVWRRELTPLEVSGMYVAGRNRHVSFATIPLQITILTSSDPLRLAWPAGILQWSPAVAGPDSDLPSAVSPYRLTPSGQQRFYRLRQ